ncbi:MAG: acetate--CoA ligase family protein, partial [Deltaproteobacteria bacterium]|nr:acetate--CoA ligase family protein [Deltaproteobacteria bacterium]
LTPADVEDMMHCLKARRILEGYRGAETVVMEKLTKMLLLFSGLVIKIEPIIESIDLNPVMCSQERCAVADARIMLAK